MNKFPLWLSATGLCCGCTMAERTSLSTKVPSGSALESSAAAATTRGLGMDTCYNLEYAFTCVPPRGFVITSEGIGPGEIMTMVKRSLSTSDEANLTLRVYPLHGDRLKWLVEERVLSAIKKAEGVQNLQTSQARLGMRDGMDIRYDRQYATGVFHAHVFCFERGGDAYIAQYSAPGSRAEQDPLEAFVSSLAFR